MNSAPEYAGMPDSAVAAGAVDLLVPVEDMPDQILATQKARQAALEGQSETQLSAVRLAICEILLSRLGHDFSQYKTQTFMRRAQRRMQVLRLTRFDEYLRRLESDRDQVMLLFRDLLISVTSFFRDPGMFAVLARRIIPGLFAGKDASHQVRIWIAGCATGEEAYSIAILVREHMDTLAVTPKVQIFASDIDDVGIATARAGRYPGTLMDGVSAERRARFFIEGASGYTVRQEIRELCTFSAHSLIRDPPFSRIDLVSCRNLLIYLDIDLQDRIIPIFHYALVPGGVLVLGSSELIARHETLFTTLDRAHRIFQRQNGIGQTPSVTYTPEPDLRPRVADMHGGKDGKTQIALAVADANRRVLERFASAFVVVEADGTILHYSNRTGRFLEPPLGTPSSNLFDMARPLWGLEIRQALRHCVETGHPVEQRGSFMSPNGNTPQIISVTIEPLPLRDAAALYMVVFSELSADPSDHPPSSEMPPAEVPSQVAHLERQNRDLRQQLRAVTEEHAVAMEELRSSNEELQSVNEEMQSTNEELETSKEEIQSVNEELNTVNSQLSAKVEQLDRANSDLRNLFESTKVATVFLDPYLIIRSFTPEIAKIYNLIPSDLGRPLSDIVSRLDYPTLREDVQHVVQTLEPLEKRVDRADGSAHYLMRILPYRSPDNAVDGSLVTFVDVTSVVRAEVHQRLLVDELNHRVKNMLTVVISLASNTVARSASLEEFSEVFLGRIEALNASYGLLSREGWSPVPLRDVLLQEVTPFMTGDKSNVRLNGPPVALPPRVALVLGIAFHELTTNAVKYGALSVQEGCVVVTWSVTSDTAREELLIDWVEQGGPTVTPPARSGFGMSLIERSIAHDLSGEAKLEFLPSGVRAHLRAPLRGQPE